MPAGNAVWGIDVGQCALKALKLRAVEGGKVEAVAFDVIEHPKILSQPDADRDELIAAALEKFASRNEWQGDAFFVGVPGQQTFARFCKMPPIDLKKDAKKIPDLVRYEASQQIPFDIEDVVWDYQVFTSESSPDIEVGIFAIRKDLIRKHLEFFAKVGIAPLGVQTTPAALYNFAHFDGQLAGEGGAAVLIDVGAQNTDLVIAEPNAAWTRSIPSGGNTFTEALVRAFKLSFAKAESLKRTAATSQYARQIFQAMRPIFADLVAEIQRSIGFYSSTHRDVELRKVLALGNAFRLPGLQKYLENNLTIAKVAKLEKFERLVPSATTNAPQFTENLLSFAAAYGLAIQGLGLGKIRASLLPTELARVAVWRKKRPYFIASAAALVAASVVPVAANYLDKQTLESSRAAEAQRSTAAILSECSEAVKRFQQAQTNTSQWETDIQNVLNLRKDKLTVPRVLTLVTEALPPVQPPELARVESGEKLKELIKQDPKKYDRALRGQFYIDSFSLEYVPNVDSTPLVTLTGTESGAGGPLGGGPPGGFGGGPPGGFGGGPPGGWGGPPGAGPPGMGRGGRPPAPQAAPESGAPGEGGFIVRVTGRLLYGRRQSDASRWLESEYFVNLRELSRKQGWGFYIPDDDPKEPDKRAIVKVSLAPYYADLRPGTGFAPPGGAGPDATKPRDPITDEDASNDWKVELAFKVKLGEPPAKADAAAGHAAGEGGAPAPAGPRQPG